MKVVALNGSPKVNGNTVDSIKLLTEQFEDHGIELEIINVGKETIKGCIGCNACGRTKDEKCILKGDIVNDTIQKLKEADGIIIASPVHYAGPTATLKALLDRAFYTSTQNGNLFRHKVGVSLAVTRRTGGLHTIDQIDRYINYSEMFRPTSNYWGVAHGTMPGETIEDLEGQQIMRLLGKNMITLLKLRENGKHLLEENSPEAKVMTNFVR